MEKRLLVHCSLANVPSDRLNSIHQPDESSNHQNPLLNNAVFKVITKLFDKNVTLPNLRSL